MFPSAFFIVFVGTWPDHIPALAFDLLETFSLEALGASSECTSVGELSNMQTIEMPLSDSCIVLPRSLAYSRTVQEGCLK